ncbi:unnamed protein product [Merluccius merluccius]
MVSQTICSDESKQRIALQGRPPFSGLPAGAPAKGTEEMEEMEGTEEMEEMERTEEMEEMEGTEEMEEMEEMEGTEEMEEMEGTEEMASSGGRATVKTVKKKINIVIPWTERMLHTGKEIPRMLLQRFYWQQNELHCLLDGAALHRRPH